MRRPCVKPRPLARRPPSSPVPWRAPVALDLVEPEVAELVCRGCENAATSAALLLNDDLGTDDHLIVFLIRATLTIF